MLLEMLIVSANVSGDAGAGPAARPAARAAAPCRTAATAPAMMTAGRTRPRRTLMSTAPLTRTMMSSPLKMQRPPWTTTRAKALQPTVQTRKRTKRTESGWRLQLWLEALGPWSLPYTGCKNAKGTILCPHPFLYCMVYMAASVPSLNAVGLAFLLFVRYGQAGAGLARPVERVWVWALGTGCCGCMGVQGNC